MLLKKIHENLVNTVYSRHLFPSQIENLVPWIIKYGPFTYVSCLDLYLSATINVMTWSVTFLTFFEILLYLIL